MDNPIIMDDSGVTLFWKHPPAQKDELQKKHNISTLKTSWFIKSILDSKLPFLFRGSFKNWPHSRRHETQFYEGPQKFQIVHPLAEKYQS